MTRTPGFTARIERALVAQGFRKCASTLRLVQDDVSTYVDTRRGFGTQMFVDVGFWLAGLGGPTPLHVHETHLYYRLEALFPAHLETIRCAGAIGDPAQPASLNELLVEIAGEMGRDLRALGTTPGLRAAWLRGRLSDGLVRAEARAHFECGEA